MGISTIIAMSPSGVPYFSGNYICPNGSNCHIFANDKAVKKDPTLISGFFTALINMASTFGGEIQKVEFEKFRYMAHSAPNVIMVMVIDIADDVNDYQNRLILCLDLFTKNFGKYIEDWKGNLAFFDAYQMILEEASIFDEQPTYRKNCLECEFNEDCSFRMITGIQVSDVSEKMKKFSKYNFIAKAAVVLKETKKYIKQLRRFKDFKQKYEEKKSITPTLKIVDMI
jgi:hypothetical protein